MDEHFTPCGPRLATALQAPGPLQPLPPMPGAEAEHPAQEWLLAMASGFADSLRCYA